MSGQIDLCVIPTPKKIVAGKGFLRFAGDASVVVRVAAGSALRGADIAKTLRPLGSARPEIRRDLNDKTWRIAVGRSVSMRLPAARKPSARFGREGYRLTISPSLIVIDARSDMGLYYGLMTLRQVLRNHGRVPCVTVDDWPDMPVRGIHMDLKGCTPTPAHMCKTIETLAEYKINTLLMEYEDAIQLESAPGVAKPSAWSRKDCDKIARTARRCHMNLMPLLQSLGHAEYVLRNDAYAHLRETPDNIQQYCPSKAETFAFWRDMADEIIDIFPETPYFHVGADETRQLGECPRCKARLGKGEDVLDIYLEHMEKVWAHVLDGGRTPIFWDDIVSRHFTPERCRRVPKGVAAMVWLYFLSDPRVTTVRVNERNYALRDILRHDRLRRAGFREATASDFYDDMPPEVYRQYKRYLETPEGAPDLHPAPFIEMFSERGYEVIGGSAIRVSGSSVGLPDIVTRIDNVRHWGRIMKDAGQSGVISTAWSRAGSTARPQVTNEAMWYPMVVSAQWYWSADGADVDRFQALFDRDFFGVDDDGWISQVMEAVSETAAPVARREMGGLKARRHRDVLESTVLAGRIHSIYKNIVDGMHVYMMSYYAKDVPFHEKLNRRRQHLRAGIDGLLSLKEQARTDYLKTMLPEEAEELVQSQFAFFEQVDLGA